MQQVITKITENMQIIYRKAIDADTALDALQKSGKGKFSVIFTEDSGFETRSKRFGPYVDELAMDITKLQDKETDVEKAIVSIVKKMELMLITLAKFKETL
ncbi:MAG: topoisomerase IA-like protein [Glaciecola sp.]